MRSSSTVTPSSSTPIGMTIPVLQTFTAGSFVGEWTRMINSSRSTSAERDPILANGGQFVR